MDFVRKRITVLRMQRGLSEYQLSYALGHSKNYIHNIVNGHSLPSVKELLFLIEELGVRPQDFFAEEGGFRNPVLANRIMDGIKDLDDEDLNMLILMTERMKKTEK